jgi:hypothetical protein
VSEARAIEANHSVVTSKKVNKPTDREVLKHRPIAMEQDDAGGCRVAPFDVVETYTFALEKAANRRVPPLCHKREYHVPDDHKHQQRGSNDKDGFSSTHDS